MIEQIGTHHQRQCGEHQGDYLDEGSGHRRLILTGGSYNRHSYGSLRTDQGRPRNARHPPGGAADVAAWRARRARRWRGSSATRRSSRRSSSTRADRAGRRRHRRVRRRSSTGCEDRGDRNWRCGPRRRPAWSAPTSSAVWTRGRSRRGSICSVRCFVMTSPQKGRYRQFFSSNSRPSARASPALDVEVIELARDWLRAWG